VGDLGVHLLGDLTEPGIRGLPVGATIEVQQLNVIAGPLRDP
jgi:hypothetical protein